jgi:hypothetical protein
MFARVDARVGTMRHLQSCASVDENYLTPWAWWYRPVNLTPGRLRQEVQE